MKPRIFIGSSSESLEDAKLVKKKLQRFAYCQVWNEGFFRKNESSFESLTDGATLFDFAILVAGPDDVQIKRGKKETVTRDNIIFEFGLYVGRLGKNRSFFLRSKGLDVPSDFFGITQFEYKQPKDKRGKTLDEVCDEIKASIKEVWATYELSFIPSTILATSYYDNFLFPVCEELSNPRKRTAKKQKFEDYKITVVLPASLPDNYDSEVKAYLNKNKYEEYIVKSTTRRKYPFYLDFATSTKKSNLELYDAPTILKGLKRAIELAIPTGTIGENKREDLLKRKEINNFYRTLNYLINKSAITRDNVELVIVDV